MALPLALVTVAVTGPAACVGAVAVICESELIVKVALVPSKVTLVTAGVLKFVPVMTTGLPPAVVPDNGLSPVIVGTAIAGASLAAKQFDGRPLDDL
ncbi:hypothetical protein [Kitasatospora sp. GP30]|uniref:hypothetical protein n=1 Tax=Kitasatospora sp. GP30 TaxID=3035084 RepID=UPI00247394DB|nr:hypothetical protein [Kitasatospora sp. GP30]